MTVGARSIELFTIAGVAFLAVGSLVATGLARGLAHRFAHLPPGTRHRALVLLASVPMLVALGLLFAATLPSLTALLTAGSDHCAAHDDGHAHLCVQHPPHVGARTELALLVMCIVGYGIFRAARAATTAWRASRIVDMLERTGEVRDDLGVTVIHTTKPVCVAAGLVHPQVFVSRALLDALDDEQLAVVLAHERAHVRHRDALTALLVRVLCVAHTPSTARWLVHELETAAEQACDEEAAGIVGDRVTVAATILAVAQIVRREGTERLGIVASSFGESAIERRVASLLADPIPQPSLRAFRAASAAFVITAIVGADELHHVTESLLSAIAH